MSPTTNANPVWGIGTFVDGAGRASSIEVTTVEYDREVEVARRRLAALGVGVDDVVLVVAGVVEAVQFGPFQRAARRLGGISCTAEPSPFDAARTASFLDQYDLRAALGLDAAVLDGLEQRGDPAAVLRKCEQLLARVDAVPRLRELGLDPMALHVLGPTVAVECPERAGAHVGSDAWSVAVEDGWLTVAPAAGRSLPVAPIRTALRGTVILDRCGCGSDDPRIVVDDGSRRPSGG
jgi:hypothetical protein